MLNRGLSTTTIQESVAAIMSQGTPQDTVDLFVMAFQTRDIRGGKGERDLFRALWTSLATHEPNAAIATIPHIPEYGFWEDINQLAHMTKSHHIPVRSALLYAITSQIKNDYDALNTEKSPKLSLVGRHAPREHNTKPEDKALAKELARLMFPDDKTHNAKYRKHVVALAAALKVPEVAMAAGNWSSLDPVTMPGRCLKTKIKALLNKPVSGRHGRKTILTSTDRVLCATKFSDHLSNAAKGLAKVKGSDVVFPYELVKKVLAHMDSGPMIEQWTYDSDHNGYMRQIPNPNYLSPEELDAIEAQWRSIVDPIKALGVLDSWLPMCDFSGSMSGNPMNNAMALGLIIANCNTGVFKDTILTFDSVPTLHKFKTCGFVSRIAEVRHLAQGTSTDFQAAYNLILKRLIDKAVPAAMWPKYLLCLTDMGFDTACGFGQYSTHTYTRHSQAVKTAQHETHMQIIRRSFAIQAQALFGQDAPQAPICVCWNLSGSAQDFQATYTEPGILQVSGWSPSLINVLATRGIDAFNSEQILRVILDDPRYDAIRSTITTILLPQPQLTKANYSSTFTRLSLPRSPPDSDIDDDGVE
jgi:hypothetical protein